jgi:DNA-binding NarL/FixJ family response regulator
MNARFEPPTTVFLCDDSPSLRQLLRAVLESEAGIVVVGEAGDGHGLAEAVRDAGADVVVLDVSMPRVDGLSALTALRAAGADVGIIVLSGREPAATAAKAIALGADRYLKKSDGMEQVRAAVRAVAAERRGRAYNP